MNTTKKKKGRPKFEDDNYRGFMLKATVKSQFDSRRTKQNSFYYAEAITTIFEMEKEGEDMEVFTRRKNPTPKQKGLSILYEIGRISDKEIMKSVICQLAKEMKENSQIKVKQWGEYVRAYRLKLKREGVF